tara:strand:+ start:696 stop:830 length:135 start_codon:yes stop_codon:yes gene_type:complete
MLFFFLGLLLLAIDITIKGSVQTLGKVFEGAQVSTKKLPVYKYF